MNIKAIIPSGQTEITVNGLHQWDYGQELEIHCDKHLADVEVHFACSGMTEAVVRNCAVIEGVAKASIPDRCIEQTTPIVAWVYHIDGTSARTIATIRMPIIARAKPAPSASVPTIITDKYTELVSAINEQVGALTEGRVVASKARNADHSTDADNATNAQNAQNAKDAENAEKAEWAREADSAKEAEKALALSFNLVGTAIIVDGTTENDDSQLPSGALEEGSVYLARFYQSGGGLTAGTTDTGIFIYNPHAESVRACLGGYRIAEIVGGRQVFILNNDNYNTLTVRGTLYIYKIGTLPT